MLIPFTYNILKKHPALMVMIHRAEDMTSGESDPFNASEPNPTLTNAIESSLWELHTQRQHYHSSVSTLVRIFEEAFTKPSYSLEDFLDHTYTTVSESLRFSRKSSTYFFVRLFSFTKRRRNEGLKRSPL